MIRLESSGLKRTIENGLDLGSMSNIEAPRVYNVNVGVLGHVDSGKTSLGDLCVAKAQIWER